MHSVSQFTATASPPTRLSSRQELFSLHVARGASFAQAARLAGYSPQGARQRGSVLMAESDIRLRVETLRRAWMAEREGRVERAIERLDRIIDMAIRTPAADRRPEGDGLAAQADRRHPRPARRPLHRQSGRRPVQSCFRPEGGRGPRFQPEPYPALAEAEVSIPEPDEPAEPEDDHTSAAAITSAAAPPVSGADGKVQMMTFAAGIPPGLTSAFPAPLPRYSPVTPAG